MCKLPEILKSAWGAIMAIAVAGANFFAGYEFMVAFVFLCAVLDQFFGTVVAVKQHKFVLSELMRNTVVKLMSYGGVMFIVVGIEHVLGSDSRITMSIVTAVIAAAELWSISGNVLIIKPDFVFFKLLRPTLKGEIGRKLGIEPEEVDKALSEIHAKRKKKKKDEIL